MQPIRIPFSTVALNINQAWFRQEIPNVSIETSTRDVLVTNCAINKGGKSCGSRATLSFRSKSILLRGDRSRRDLVLVFHDYLLSDPPHIPPNYTLPFPLTFRSELIRDLIYELVSSYFALDVPFALLSSCVPASGVTLKDVMIVAPRQRILLVASNLVAPNLIRGTAKQDANLEVVLDFVTHTIRVNGTTLLAPRTQFAGQWVISNAR